MWLGLALAVSAAAALVWFLREPPLHVAGPIILVSVDTLRADRLPAYGYEGVETPAIDRFAADAVLFERAYSHSPQTLPAHVSMFTGLLPVEHGVRDNLGFAVGPEHLLLPELLTPLGYRSAGVVSSYVLRKEAGLARGFEIYDDRLPQAPPSASNAQVQRDGTESLQVAERWLDENGVLRRAGLPVSAPVRTAHALRTAGPLSRATNPTTARSRTPTRSWAACSTTCARAACTTTP